ncbi:hypothetical protein AN640_07090 [Candidatus Epulonipiscium fishelsonii]|uniref:Uncharacterized protein n=1 Tax=Candidatus Epulonipiscium fishelsonii TaxID=77094 RepID=A0ACC8XGV0_9FIRM|nr:hypothetical protein AN640_07090 [Epulopiscium sp. SCG-D08WGA-EpuloA1]OON90281.1 MAG: hypothetical protein ATN32_04370 [Epulopiscium sp. AS2M-Bin002]
MDTSVVLVALKLAPYLQMNKEHSGIKFNIVFNGEFPEKLNICEGKVNDRKCKDGSIEDNGCIGGYNQLSDIKFVTRGVKNAVVMDLWMRNF